MIRSQPFITFNHHRQAGENIRIINGNFLTEVSNNIHGENRGFAFFYCIDKILALEFDHRRPAEDAELPLMTARHKDIGGHILGHKTHQRDLDFQEEILGFQVGNRVDTDEGSLYLAVICVENHLHFPTWLNKPQKIFGNGCPDKKITA